jgi:uncharacterized membrane protein YqjE
MSNPQERTGGIFAALRRILDGGLAIAENRLELFAVELREEKCRLVEVMIWAAAVVVLGMMTLTMLTFLVVIVLWNDARVAALLTLSLLYLLATALAWRGLRRRLSGSPVFSGTLSEIRKDRACLRPEN